MKKLYLCFLLVLSSFVHLLAVPNEANIQMSPEGDHCFTESNKAKVTWSKIFKEEFNPKWPWPTTWTAVNGLGPTGNSSIHVDGLDVQPTIDAATGEYTINFPKPGIFKVTVKIWYKADRTTIPLYANESFTKTFNIAFYKVKKFKVKSKYAFIPKDYDILKKDFNIEIEPSSGTDLFVWSRDTTDITGVRKAYLKLGEPTCATADFTVVSVTFSKELVYVPEKLGVLTEVLFTATVEPASAKNEIKFDQFPNAGMTVKALDNGSGFDFKVQSTNAGYQKYEYDAKIKASGDVCGSMFIIKVKLILPEETTIVNGTSTPITISTQPPNVGTITRTLNSTKPHVGSILEEGKTFESGGNRDVFKDIAERDKETIVISGSIKVAIDGQPALIWPNVKNIKVTVTNAPPQFKDRLLPKKVVFNSPSFDIKGAFVQYSDIDDSGKDYSQSIANTNHDGVIPDAIVKATVLEPEYADPIIKFPINFSSEDGIRIFRHTSSFNVTFTADFKKVFGIEGQIQFKFEVPMSERSRFVINSVLTSMGIVGVAVPQVFTTKLSNVLNQLTGVDRYVVKFTPIISFSSGGNSIKVDGDQTKGLPFESTTVTTGSQKINIYIADILKQF